jgi:hypothetical protein
MVCFIHSVLVRQALDHAASLVILRFVVQDRILVQKTILDHVGVFDIEHRALEKDVVLAEVLTGADVVDAAVALSLLVVLLVVVLLRSRVQSTVLVEILWWARLNFNFPLVSLRSLWRLVCLFDSSQGYEPVSFYEGECSCLEELSLSTLLAWWILALNLKQALFLTSLQVVHVSFRSCH